MEAEIILMDIGYIRPSQVRFSEANVKEKVRKALEAGNFTITSEGQRRFKYGSSKSIFSNKDAIPVLRTSFGYVAIDGHHNILASLSVGATHIPIWIILTKDDAKDDHNFWQWALENNCAYLKNKNGQIVSSPPSFQELEDDIIRYFVTLSARRFGRDLIIEHSTGALFPLWVKIFKDIPFIEFKIADVLYAHGFVYEDGCNLQDKIEEARAILLANPVSGLRLLPEKEHYSNSELIQRWIKEEEVRIYTNSKSDASKLLK